MIPVFSIRGVALIVAAIFLACCAVILIVNTVRANNQSKIRPGWLILVVIFVEIFVGSGDALGWLGEFKIITRERRPRLFWLSIMANIFVALAISVIGIFMFIAATKNM